MIPEQPLIHVLYIKWNSILNITLKEFLSLCDQYY